MMTYNEIIDKLDTWIEESVDDYRDDEENEHLMFEDLDNLHTEKFEHAFIIRWGSEKHDFPRLAGSYLTNEYYILQSGEIRDKIVIGDMDAKTEIDVQQLVYKYLLEDMMEGCENGYVIDSVGLPGEDQYRVVVEKIKDD